MKSAPILIGRKLSLRERLLFRSTRAANGCWVWDADVNQHGYGLTSVNGKNRQAHRVSYEQFVGPIPDDLVVDHMCCNRRCINPQHLQLVSFSENLRLGRARSPVCRNGHPKTPESTYRTKSGGFMCRICMNLKQRRHRQKYLNY